MEERLSDKIDKSAASLEASMATMSKNVQAGQNLYVYLPLTDALIDYEGQEVTLFSPSCNQQASAKLKKEGQNYCCNINYNFSGECTLKWTALNALGEQFQLTEHLELLGSSEFRLGSTVHRLNISIPKSIALADYTGSSMSLIIDTQSYSATMQDSANAYTTVIYSDYDGAANLSYNFLDGNSGQLAMLEPVMLNTEIIDLEVGIRDVDPALLSMRTVRNILASGRAKLFFEPGDVLLKDGAKYHILAVEANAIKVWSVGLMDGRYNLGWDAACLVSTNAWRAWNEKNPDFGVQAIGSGMLLKDEVLSMSREDRLKGLNLGHMGANGTGYYYTRYLLGDRDSVAESNCWSYVPYLDDERYGNRLFEVTSKQTPTGNSILQYHFNFAYYGLWLGELPVKREDSTAYSFDEISEICELGLADDYDLTIVGTELCDGWFVIGSKKDGVKDQLRIWKKQNLGNSSWADAKSIAESYKDQFNSLYSTDCALSSELLTKDDVNVAWFTENRKLGYHWWTATAGSSSGTYWRVLNNGDLVETTSRNLTGCDPAVWIK